MPLFDTINVCKTAVPLLLMLIFIQENSLINWNIFQISLILGTLLNDLLKLKFHELVGSKWPKGDSDSCQQAEMDDMTEQCAAAAAW